MDAFYPILEALFNAIASMFYMISKFDIMAVDTQKLAFLGELTSYAGRIVYQAGIVIVKFIQIFK